MHAQSVALQVSGDSGPKGAPGVYVCVCACTSVSDWTLGAVPEVSNVSERSHRRCSLMKRDDLVEPRLW